MAYWRVIKWMLICTSLWISWSVEGQILSISSIDKAFVKATDRIALYALPRTTLEIRCHISSRQQVVGPYAQYAREFLGREAIMHPAVQWDIDSVSIVPVTSFDPSQIYLVKFGKKIDYRVFEEMTRKGFIIFPLDNKKAVGYSDSVVNLSRESAVWSILDLPFASSSSDTIYQVVRKDSLLIRQAVVKPRSTSVTPYERAKELAKQIQQLHQRRIDLIMAEDDPVPANEKSVQWLADQLKQKEEEYLQLFLGKTVSQTYVHTFYYVPNSGEKVQSAEIFWFSPQRGISTKTDASAIPVYITIEPQNTVSTVRDYQSLLTTFSAPCILYRVPDIARVSISWGNRVLTRVQLPVYQLGALVPWFPTEP